MQSLLSVWSSTLACSRTWGARAPFTSLGHVPPPGLLHPADDWRLTWWQIPTRETFVWVALLQFRWDHGPQEGNSAISFVNYTMQEHCYSKQLQGNIRHHYRAIVSAFNFFLVQCNVALSSSILNKMSVGWLPVSLSWYLIYLNPIFRCSSAPFSRITRTTSESASWNCEISGWVSSPPPKLQHYHPPSS